MITYESILLIFVKRRKGHVTFFRPENIFTTFLHPVILIWKVFIYNFSERHHFVTFFSILYKIGTTNIFEFRFLMDYMFWDVLTTISLSLQNVCLSVCLSVCDTNFVAALIQKLKVHAILYSFASQHKLIRFRCMTQKMKL